MTARSSKEAGQKLLAACKDGIDLTGTEYEAKWIENGKAATAKPAPWPARSLRTPIC